MVLLAKGAPFYYLLYILPRRVNTIFPNLFLGNVFVVLQNVIEKNMCELNMERQASGGTDIDLK